MKKLSSFVISWGPQQANCVVGWVYANLAPPSGSIILSRELQSWHENVEARTMVITAACQIECRLSVFLCLGRKSRCQHRLAALSPPLSPPTKWIGILRSCLGEDKEALRHQMADTAVTRQLVPSKPVHLAWREEGKLSWARKNVASRYMNPRGTSHCLSHGTVPMRGYFVYIFVCFQ